MAVKLERLPCERESGGEIPEMEEPHLRTGCTRCWWARPCRGRGNTRSEEVAGDSASGGSASSDERHESGKAFDRLKKIRLC